MWCLITDRALHGLHCHCTAFLNFGAVMWHGMKPTIHFIHVTRQQPSTYGPSLSSGAELCTKHWFRPLQADECLLLGFSVTMWETTANFRKSFSFVPHFFPQKWICFFQTFTPLWLISEMRHCNWNSFFFHDSTRSISLWIGLRVVKLPTSRRLGERPRFRNHIVFWYQLIQRPCP